MVCPHKESRPLAALRRCTPRIVSGPDGRSCRRLGVSSADLSGARGGNPHTGVGDVELDLHDVQLSADVRRARVAGSTPALAASWTSPGAGVPDHGNRVTHQPEPMCHPSGGTEQVRRAPGRIRTCDLRIRSASTYTLNRPARYDSVAFRRSGAVYGPAPSWLARGQPATSGSKSGSKSERW